MGLDIYVYTRAEQEAHDAFDARWGEGHDDDTANPYGKPYEQWTEDERKAKWAEYDKIPRSKDVPSKDHPDNINNRRYLRSSYNAGGFNRVVPEVTGRNDLDYYGIFSPLREGDEYEIKVDDPAKVAEARKRALECVALLEEAATKPVYRIDSVRAQSLRPQDTDGPMGDAKALAMFHQEKAEHEERTADGKSPFGGNYGKALGDFFFDEPLEVVGALPGVDVLGAPCVHLVYRGELHHSYVESAKVLVEFCDELLDLIAADGCAYIHWSG